MSVHRSSRAHIIRLCMGTCRIVWSEGFQQSAGDCHALKLTICSITKYLEVTQHELAILRLFKGSFGILQSREPFPILQGVPRVLGAR